MQIKKAIMSILAISLLLIGTVHASPVSSLTVDGFDSVEQSEGMTVSFDGVSFGESFVFSDDPIEEKGSFAPMPVILDDSANKHYMKYENDTYREMRRKITVVTIFDSGGHMLYSMKPDTRGRVPWHYIE